LLQLPAAITSQTSSVAYGIPHRACHAITKTLALKNNCATIHSTKFCCCVQFVVVFNLVSREEKKMAIISDVAALGSVVFAAIFSLWLLKQLFTSN